MVYETKHDKIVSHRLAVTLHVRTHKPLPHPSAPLYSECTLTSVRISYRSVQREKLQRRTAVRESGVSRHHGELHLNYPIITALWYSGVQEGP